MKIYHSKRDTKNELFLVIILHALDGNVISNGDACGIDFIFRQANKLGKYNSLDLLAKILKIELILEY